MTLAKFIAWHEPALAIDEVRHGIILNAFARALGDSSAGLSYWTLGGPGQCAIQAAHRSIVLAGLNKDQCHDLAVLTARTNYPGVTGPDLTARWFTDRALQLGSRFAEPVRMRLHSIVEKPRLPGTSGHARAVTIQDAALLVEWFMEFHREAIPSDPAPVRQDIERAAGEGRFLFWIYNERPVAMAGIVRQLKNSAGITGVYTPPALRGRGYAGSVTAVAVESIHASGRKFAYLYTDLNNPSSNRCYAKIGFRPVCDALQFYRMD